MLIPLLAEVYAVAIRITCTLSRGTPLVNQQINQRPSGPSKGQRIEDLGSNMPSLPPGNSWACSHENHEASEEAIRTLLFHTTLSLRVDPAYWDSAPEDILAGPAFYAR